MFFRDFEKNIQDKDLVLEIGPGDSPHPRSDVLLERKFSSSKLSYAQRGFRKASNYTKPIHYYDGGRFPFKDREFDYVICSHVIEHVPENELRVFISEMERVAKKGYIEFPNVLYELINFQPVHMWYMNMEDNNLIFMSKKKMNKESLIHSIYRAMFYDGDQFAQVLFDRYKKIFFVSYDWKEKINYKIVNNFQELITVKSHDEYIKLLRSYKHKVQSIQKENDTSTYHFISMKISSIILHILNLLVSIKILVQKNFSKQQSNNISKTAIIYDPKLIKISPTAQIQEYVIIKAFTNTVVIGSYSQLNPYTVVYGHNKIIIGDNVMIAPHCMIASGNHDFKQLEKPMRNAGNLTKGPIIIEDDVWIGANSTILDGVKIGRGSVIAANSVVNKNIPSYSIAAGSPAKIIGTRLKYAKSE